MELRKFNFKFNSLTTQRDLTVDKSKTSEEKIHKLKHLAKMQKTRIADLKTKLK